MYQSNLKRKFKSFIFRFIEWIAYSLLEKVHTDQSKVIATIENDTQPEIENILCKEEAPEYVMEETIMEIEKNLLTINQYSRPGTKLHAVKAIVMHWVANPNTSPEFNRNWFEGRKNGQHGYGSAHYIIGIDGSIMRCIPDEEVAYHCGSKEYTKWAVKKFGEHYTTRSSPNFLTIGIELCHPDWTGKFTEQTLSSAVQLVSYLIQTHDLTIDDITTHKEVVGWKDCPKYWVERPDQFNNFKNRVYEYCCAFDK